MEKFEILWKEVLKEIIIPKGYFENNLETIDDKLLILKAFQYCVIMRTKEGIEEYLNFHGSKPEFFKKKIIELLNIENETEENKNKIVIKYLKNNIIDNGFVCHTTNSLSAQQIITNGLTSNNTNSYTESLIEKLKEIFPEGFIKSDLNYIIRQKERKGWFYDRSPSHFKRYAHGPEWFKRLVQSSNYIRRDFDGAIKFIKSIMDSYNEPAEKKQKAIEFVEKNWNIYSPTTPHMLLISTKNKELRNPDEVMLIEQLPIENQLEYYTDLYFKVTDENTEQQIFPEDIIDIDIDEIIKNNSIVLH